MKRMKKLLLIVLLVCATVLIENFVVFSTETLKVSIVYSNGEDVFLQNLDSKQIVNLTKVVDEKAIFPAISPDGKLVAFVTDNGEMLPNQLYLTEVVSDRIIGISNFPGIYHASPSFSPDSKKIVCSIYSKEDKGGMAIYDITEIKDGEILPRNYYLIPETSHNCYPIWIQDGTQIMSIEKPTKGSLAGKYVLGLCSSPDKILRSGVLFPVEIEVGILSWSPSGGILFVRSGKIYSDFNDSKKQKKIISGNSPRWISKDMFLFRNEKGELFLYYNKKKEKILENIPEWYSVIIQ